MQCIVKHVPKPARQCEPTIHIGDGFSYTIRHMVQTWIFTQAWLESNLQGSAGKWSNASTDLTAVRSQRINQAVQHAQWHDNHVIVMQGPWSERRNRVVF